MKRQVCLVPVEGKTGTKFGNMKTVDISRGGVGIISQRVVAVNERIAVELELMPDQEPALVMGQVQWVDQIAESGNYRIGLKFTSTLLAGSRNRLKNYFPQ